MTLTYSELRIVPRNYELFVGLDVDKTSMSVSIMDHERLIRSLRIPYQADHLTRYLRNHFPGQTMAFAYEAGPTGFGLFDHLHAAGFACLVAAPSMIPTAPGHHVKTNRLDSQKLAELLRGGQLKSIHIPSPCYRHLRHLVQLRDTFVRQAQAHKTRIKALLLYEGIPFPQFQGQESWSNATLTALEQLPCAPPVRFKMDRLLSTLRFSQEQIRQTLKAIRQFCKNEAAIAQDMEFVQSIPGFGAITASHLLARIGDPQHLHNVRQLAGFLGLAPMEYSTGDRIRRGPITHTGDSRLRNKLIQAAWAAIRVDSELKDFYERIYQRHPKNQSAQKAIIAVARKLTTRVYAVLKEQRLYQKHPISLAEQTIVPGNDSRPSRTRDVLP